MSLKRRDGFTLLELTIVMAVIGVAAAMLLPALARTREAGRRASCLSNLVQLNMALQMYASEHKRLLPWSGNGDVRCLNRLRNDYLTDVAILICPSDPKSGEVKKQWDDFLKKAAKGDGNPPHFEFTSYMYVGWFAFAPIAVPPVDAPMPKVPMLWDRASKGNGGANLNHIPGGSNVVWMDGSAEFIPLTRFHVEGCPANPGSIPLSDTAANPWEKLLGKNMPGAPPRTTSIPRRQTRIGKMTKGIPRL